MRESKWQSNDFVPLKKFFWPRPQNRILVPFVFKISDDHRMSPLLKNDVVRIKFWN